MAVASTVTNTNTANPLAQYQTATTNAKGVSTTSNEAALGKLSQDYTTFLKLLTTQLQNQDPTAPLDSAQFTQQLVQFSGVEQQIKVNQKLDSLINLQQGSNGVGNMLGYLGKSVEISGDKFSLQSGTDSQFSYNLTAATNTNTIKILDKDGLLVRSQAGSTSIGKHVVTWDGKDDNGNTLPNGIYTVSVDAKDASGNKVAANTTGFGIVNGVETTTKGAVLNIGALQIATDKVLAIKEALKTGA
jgi:flagellar basal-body rod modification protein FlgD